MSQIAPFEGLKLHHYGVILVDAPMRFKTYDKRTTVAARATATRPERVHYKTMTIGEIKTLPVADLAAKDCALFFWTSSPFNQIALEVIEAWGFEYKTWAFTWFKVSSKDPAKFVMGNGLTGTRSNAELVLLATRGHPKRLNADVRQVIVAPRREHSRKPDIYPDIERLFAGPYVELFARQKWPGWDSFGDQVNHFDPPESTTATVPEFPGAAHSRA